MKPKTILSLYNGEYTFIERPVTKDGRYTDNLSKCISIEDKLEKIFDKETFDLITKALEYQNEMSSVEMEEAFEEISESTPYLFPEIIPSIPLAVPLSLFSRD